MTEKIYDWRAIILPTKKKKRIYPLSRPPKTQKTSSSDTLADSPTLPRRHIWDYFQHAAPIRFIQALMRLLLAERRPSHSCYHLSVIWRFKSFKDEPERPQGQPIVRNRVYGRRSTADIHRWWWSQSCVFACHLILVRHFKPKKQQYCYHTVGIALERTITQNHGQKHTGNRTNTWVTGQTRNCLIGTFEILRHYSFILFFSYLEVVR